MKCTDSVVIPCDIKSGKYKLVFTSFLTNDGFPQDWLNIDKSDINIFNYNGYLEVFSLKYGLSYRAIIQKQAIQQLFSNRNNKYKVNFTTVKEFTIE